MNVSANIGVIMAISLFTLVINLPFGYLRQGVRKYSLLWFLYIHVPIPLIAFIRITSGLDWRAIPIFLAAAITGQIVGGRIRHVKS